MLFVFLAYFEVEIDKIHLCFGQLWIMIWVTLYFKKSFPKSKEGKRGRDFAITLKDPWNETFLRMNASSYAIQLCHR